MIKKILVVEDDPDISKYLAKILKENDYHAKIAPTGTDALAQIDRFEPDLVILDLKLPDITGETVCESIKKNYPEIGIIILSSKDDISDKVKGLGLGASDYITKPFNEDELLARVKVIFRNHDPDKILQVEDLTLDPKKVEVKRANRNINITPQEFKLLQYLMNNTGVVLRRETILNNIWIYSPDVDSRVVDVYIGYLRRKIDRGHGRKLIQSVRGFGYTIK